jgi:hypothetical protein
VPKEVFTNNLRNVRKENFKMKNNKFNRISLLLMVAMLVMLLAVPVYAVEAEPEFEPVLFTEHNSQKERCESTGHKWKAWVVIEQPTCSCDGVEKSECIECGEEFYMPIPALSSPEDDVEVIKIGEPAHNPQIAVTWSARLVQIIKNFFSNFRN